MKDELMIVDGLDQTFDIDPLPILSKLDSVLQMSIDQKNPDIALQIAAETMKRMKVEGLAMCKILWTISVNWKKFGNGGNFVDYVYLSLGLSKITINRYVRIWAMFQDKNFPKEYTESLLKLGVKNLEPIATAYEAGYEFKPDDWKKLAKSADNVDVLETMREVKNVEARDTAMVLVLYRDGSIRAMTNKENVLVGYLNVDDVDDNPTINKAIKRIIKNTGMREQ